MKLGSTSTSTPSTPQRPPRARRGVSLSTRLVGLICVVVVATLATTTWRIYNDRNRSLEEELGRRLVNIVQTAALNIDGSKHEEIVAAEDANLPEFLEARSWLRRVQAANGLDSPIYTLRRLGDHTEFVVMTNETPYIGNRYQLRSEMIPVFEEGRATYTRLYTDEHGEWISAYAPIRDSQGSVVGLLDLDYPVTTFQAASRAYGGRLLAVSAVSLCLAMVLAGIFSRTITRPIRTLTETMTRVIETDDLSVQLQSSGNIRELNEMSSTFNILTDSLQRSRNAVRSTQLLVIGKLAQLAEQRDPETGEHLARMAAYTKVLARQLRREDRYRETITDPWIDAVFEAAPLHDVGKVAVVDRVLLKPGPLTEEEFALIRTHTRIGEMILEGVDFLRLACEIAGSHHEKWDGSGYPRGLVGTAIPLSARIVAVADVYDALTSRRIYKDAMPHETARQLILKDRGKHFAPDLVEAFLDVEEELVTVATDFRRAAGRHQPFPTTYAA